MSQHTEPVVFVNSLNFDTEVTRSERPVLVDVSAPWCGPCRVARPVVAELARAHAQNLKVVEIDGDQSPELVERLGVRGFPTFLGLVRGAEVTRSAGFYGKRKLESLVDELLTP
jgi:thioredoxin 1